MAHEDVNDEQSDLLETLIESGQWERLARTVAPMEPADLADFLEGLEEDERNDVFRYLEPPVQADVLAEMTEAASEDVLEDLQAEQIADLAEMMAPDDSADLLDNLDEEKSAAVLAAMEPEERREVMPLLGYEEDSAGHIMTPRICQVPPAFTVAQTRRLLASAETIDPIFYAFVVAPADGRLIGTVSVTDLFLADPQATVGDLCKRDYIYALSDEDQEEVARKFRKYDVWVMPVVDQDHRLVGRITVDDIVDVIHEEADEDLARLVGAPDIETEELAPGRIAGQRLPWLLITMFAGLVNSLIIKQMINTTASGTIAIFVPVILAMGGNTGMQSSAIAVRGIALGQQKYSRLRQIVVRELSVGIFMGVTCGLVTGAVVALVLLATGADTGPISPAALALAVGCAMGNAMVFASAFGAITPIVMHRLGVDPAIASGPFVTTSNDLSASCIYFVTCLLVINLFPAHSRPVAPSPGRAHGQSTMVRYISPDSPEALSPLSPDPCHDVVATHTSQPPFARAGFVVPGTGYSVRGWQRGTLLHRVDADGYPHPAANRAAGCLGPPGASPVPMLPAEA